MITKEYALLLAKEKGVNYDNAWIQSEARCRAVLQLEGVTPNDAMLYGGVKNPAEVIGELKSAQLMGSQFGQQAFYDPVVPIVPEKDVNKVVQIPKDTKKIADEGGSQTTLYDEFSKIETPEARYEYLLDKAKTMDVSTEKNGAIFYAGRVETASATKTARQIAENYADELLKNKGVVKLTLERTPGGKWMDDLKLYDTLPDGTYKYESLGLSKTQADSLWDVLSSRYADGASGAVTAFSKNVPEFIKPKTVFWSTELPNLINNPNVTHINIR